MDVLETDGAAPDHERRGARSVLDLGLDIQHGEDALRRRQALLQVGVQVGEPLHRLVGQQQRGDKGKQGAGRLRLADHLVAAVDDHGDDGHAAQGFHDRVRGQARPGGLVDQPENGVHHTGGPARLVRLHAIGLNVARPLEALVEQGGEAAHLDLGAGRDPSHALADLDHRHDGGGEDEKRHQRQGPVLVEHHPDQKGEREAVLADAGERGGYRAAQQVDVIDKARDQTAGRGVMEEGQIGAHQMGKHADLEVGEDALADIVHDDRLAVSGEPLDHEDGEHEDRHPIERILVLPDEHVVQHRLHEPGQRGDRRAGQHHEYQRNGDAAEMGTDVVAQQTAHQREGRVIEGNFCLWDRAQGLTQPLCQPADHSTGGPSGPDAASAAESVRSGVSRARRRPPAGRRSGPEAESHGERHRMGLISRAQLAKDALEVAGHGHRPQVQAMADLLGRISLV